MKIPTASSTTDTRSETDFHIWGWRNNLAMTIYLKYQLEALDKTYQLTNFFLCRDNQREIPAYIQSL
ncbi:MAG: hypothetical protein DRR08_09975 [Candidatus Parabeggiatoa sp. nov. 2]|nr:MAG: hypothetical protein B6247_17025 [Beggiatoa sp. 4572_84]RKZ60949.1 MAG: hypothetical protein DRR08_09975 [Gammaproteobacteria bacterium]